MSRTCYGGYGGFAAGVDSRIGRKGIQASVGFGGACYETHLRNLVYLSNAYRLPVVAKYWEHVIKMNDYQKSRFAKKARIRIIRSAPRVAMCKRARRAAELAPRVWSTT